MWVGPAWAQDADATDGPNFQNRAVARVNDAFILDSELEYACRLVGEYRELGPSEQLARLQIQHQQLQLLVEERILLQVADAQQVEFDSTDELRLERELGLAAQAYRGIEGLREALSQIGVPLEYFVERKRVNLRIGKLLLRQISQDIFVTPAQMRRYYDEHKERFARRGEVRVWRIDVYRDPDRATRYPHTEQVEAAIEGDWDPAAFCAELRARIVNGEPFAEVAREASMGLDHEGALIFELDANDRITDILRPPLGPAVADLRIGELSPVISSPRAFHLLYLVERRLPGYLPLSEVQREIESVLRDELWNERLEDWIREQKSDALVETYLEPLPTPAGDDPEAGASDPGAPESGDPPQVPDH